MNGDINLTYLKKGLPGLGQNSDLAASSYSSSYSSSPDFLNADYNLSSVNGIKNLLDVKEEQQTYTFTRRDAHANSKLETIIQNIKNKSIKSAKQCHKRRSRKSSQVHRIPQNDDVTDAVAMEMKLNDGIQEQFAGMATFIVYLMFSLCISIYII